MLFSCPSLLTDPLASRVEGLTLPKLRNSSRDILGEFALGALAKGTKVYKLAWAHFTKFGALMGVGVKKLEFDFTFVCQFLIYRLHYTGSLSSVLSSRSSIAFHWKLGSDKPCPSESTFVSIFVNGLQRKFKKVPRKAFPISFHDLSLIFSKILGNSELENLSFVNLRFITFILTLYSSFARYEKVCNLT